jgi:hypothetical protein
MKKLFVVLVAAAFVFGAASCKKDCTCKLTGNAAFDELVELTNLPTEYVYPDLSKKDCDAVIMPTVTGDDLELKWNCSQ